ncbi:hypothetical protein NEHOM01_2166, partial [Nematocida homosporus]|uniref:uncharacterized protein n=1 Tax=Nematocida homosporus TaxID=1912981 RepID=UPI0022206DBA
AFNNITALVLNELLTLNEVILFDRREEVKEFLLFNYVDEKLKAGSSLYDLQLHKLSCQLNDIDFDLYGNAISAFVRCGIPLLAIHFNDYITNPPAHIIKTPIRAPKWLRLYNTTLDSLKLDLATCQAKTAINLNYFTRQLHLHFATSNEPLTEIDLATTIRWVIYRFKKLGALRISNIKLTQEDRHAISTHTYWINDFPRIKSIQIEETNPNNPPITLLTWPYHKSSLISRPNTNKDFTIVSAAILARLATQSIQPKSLIPAHLEPQETLQMILNKIQSTIPDTTQSDTAQSDTTQSDTTQSDTTQSDTTQADTAQSDTAQSDTTQSDISCPICFQILDKSTQPEPTQSELILPTQPPQLIQPDLTQPEPTQPPDTYFNNLCYLQCGHQVCTICTLLLQTHEHYTCPICRGVFSTQSIKQLICIPLSSFVFIESSTTHPDWLKHLALKDNYIYLLHSHHSLSDFSENPSITTPQRVHIIQLHPHQ